MKSLIQLPKRLYVTLHCAAVFIGYCSVVMIRALFGTLDRASTTRYLREGGIKLLKIAQADYQIDYVDQFQYINNIPRIYMSNHLSLFDSPLLFAAIPGTIRIVAKKELTKIPIMGTALKKAEHFIVDRHNKGNNQAFYIDAKKKLDDGIGIIFFPEGTRSRTGQLQPFRMGGFRLACEVGAQIIPVGITGTQHILPADKHIVNLSQSIKIHFGEPIDTRSYKTQEAQKELMEVVHKAIEDLTK